VSNFWASSPRSSFVVFAWILTGIPTVPADILVSSLTLSQMSAVEALPYLSWRPWDWRLRLNFRQGQHLCVSQLKVALIFCTGSYPVGTCYIFTWEKPREASSYPLIIIWEWQTHIYFSFASDCALTTVAAIQRR
jgi:hypothetical protein